LSLILNEVTLVEIGCVIALLLLAWLIPGRAARPLAALESAFRRLPTSCGVQMVIVGLFAVALRAVFLPWIGPAVPLIPDEHSLMLQAMTFLEMRFANPTHPFWEHFQAMHVNQVPAYASMYFPGRGLPLAIGLLLADNAWIGVWISFVLFAMSTVWMLRGWAGPRVALAGGLLVVLRLGAGSYWINSYWGGAFTAMGAMLVFGALPRLLREPRWSHGAALGLGALILMTTRPFEGGVFCAALGLFTLPRLLKSGSGMLGHVALRAGIPLVVGVAVGAGTLLQYNAATTGDPFVAPYDLNRQQYATTPAFLIQAPITPHPPSAQIPGNFKAVYEVEADNYLASRQSIQGLIWFELVKSFHVFNFFVGFAISIAFLAGLWESRRDLPVLGTLVAFFAAHMLTSWHFPHYASPLYAPLLLITMRGLVALGRWSVNGKPVGYVISRGSLIVAANTLVVLSLHLAIGWPKDVTNSWNRTCCAIKDSSENSQVIAQLEAIPGDDLVLVYQNAFFPIYSDVVYNGADLDGSPVLFAHALSPDSDARLIDYYRDRRIWAMRFRQGGYALVPIAEDGQAPRGGREVSSLGAVAAP